MRRFLVIRSAAQTFALAVILAIGSAGGYAQETAPDDAADLEPTIVLSKAERLDSYFGDLKRESEPKSARRIADRIWSEWRVSDSATSNQLMEWANEAMRDKRYSTALDLLDQVTVLTPDYAEGWNRRATLHFIMNNHAKSMLDINRVLVLEPRHFGALMGMASILSAGGSDDAALGTYIKVLEIYPAMRAAQKRVSELADELSGDEI